MASLSLFSKYYFCRCSSELTLLAPLPFSHESSTHYSDRLHDCSVTIPRCYKGVYGYEKLKKGGGSMMQGQVVLKGRLALLLFDFKVYHFYMQKLLYPLQNCAMHLKKKYFSATIIL